MSVEFVNPTEWWLALPPPLQVTAWQPQRCSTPDRCWTAYLNQLCLDQVLPWIQAEYASAATVWLNADRASAVWEVVNGSAIELGSIRLVLLPSEVLDDAELEVPQEWLDIPDWIADYYLAVQVMLTPSDQAWIRVWGYTTHQVLKAAGEYDADDRAYTLSREHLHRDLSSMGVMLQYYQQAQTRAAVTALPQLPPAQADSLIQRLGSSSLRFPRLAVPFTLWGALLERPEWRQRLYYQRMGDSDRAIAVSLSPVSLSPVNLSPVNLSQWFQNQFAAGWQSVQALLGADAGPFALSLRSSTSAAEVAQVKQIELFPDQSVLLLLKLKAEADERVAVIAQVYPAAESPFVPTALTLSLLAETGEMLQTVQAGAADDYIQLRQFRSSIGTGFCLQITWQTASISENFVI